ncbi:MAG TPA: SpoIIE family protein phosphatase [Nocardioidaceae bacterium]|nr:SpoIIE family protein phosphatase [Nocardioidaceae bacterium]
MHAQRTFAPEGQSVSKARDFVRESLESWEAEELADEVVLATSELVTNAVIHAGTPVQVALDLDPQALRVEVQDLHPHRSLPVGLPAADEDAEHGRGLAIAAALAGSWGVDYTAGAKRIWLSFERAGAPPQAVAAAGSAPPGAASTPAPTVAEPDSTEAGVAVVALDGDGEVRSWNEDASRMFGWTAEEVIGRPWTDLVEVDHGPTTGGRSGVPASNPQRWQGACTVRRKSGPPTEAFASHISGLAGHSTVVLLVSAASRALLEWPAAQVRSAPVAHDPLGLREDALSRLGFDAYLELVVERARDQLGGQAAYLLLARDLDADYEVTTVSGLDNALRGIHLEQGAPGTPEPRNLQLPLVLTDLDDGDVPWLAGEGVRSLLVVPVVSEGRMIGALGVTSERPLGFTDEQAVLLQRVGGTVATAADKARLRASERERRGWVSFLAEAGDLLAGSLDQEMTMAITGQIVVTRLATWCALYLDDSRGVPVLQQVWHRDERLLTPLREALKQTSPDQVEQSHHDMLQGAVLNVPLVARARRIGQLTLGRPTGDQLHGEALVVAEAVARRAALAIDNAQAHGELQAVGEALQRGLLPVSIPEAHIFDTGVVYEAAGERALAGGDFYDVFPVGSGRWCFAVGDVCGTGAEAAAVTGLARHTVRALALAGFPVAATLERLNAAILEEGERSRFLTLICGTLEPVSGGRLRLSVVSAGHPLPFVVRREGRIERVGRPQPLLGVLDQVTFTDDMCLLERGDLLVAVTDGVLERREGTRMLGEEGLEADLVGAAGLPAQAVADRVRRLVADFTTRPQADDMAVLAIRVAPGD